MNTEINQDGNTGTPNPGTGVELTPKTEDKTFTQAELNQIVSGRLAKEREKYADYDTLKTKAGESDNLKKQNTELTDKVSLNDGILNEIFNDMMNGLDEEKKSLIPEQLPVVDKIKYLNKNKNVLLTKTIVKTPPPEGTPKGEAGLYGGKYASIGEWAAKDPAGYIKWRKDNPS